MVKVKRPILNLLFSTSELVGFVYPFDQWNKNLSWIFLKPPDSNICTQSI